MGEVTKIAWCDHTFNPWYGCTQVSPGCEHCYAESWAKRSGLVEWGDGNPRRRSSEDMWRKPAKWNAAAKAAGVRRRVFGPSLGDPFDPDVPDSWRRDYWTVIAECPDLDWLLLTKRPQWIKKMLPSDWGLGYPNVWLGTTGEDAERYRDRWPYLAAIPARVRFLSYEPAIGYIGDLCLVLSGAPQWVIVGEESGPQRRPMDPRWPASILHQCQRSGVPFFYKQAVVGGRMVSLPELNGKQWAQFPA